MRFKITLQRKEGKAIPINYQYPLSAVIYKIIEKGNSEYSQFLHTKGYGKGFKFFTFSQLNSVYKIAGDRMNIESEEVYFFISFHLPEAMENFIKGLFQSQNIDIADATSKMVFTVKSVESIPSPIQKNKDTEIINIQLKPLSPIVAGLQNEKGNYDFLSPDQPEYVESLIFNWRSKIITCYDEVSASSAILMLGIEPFKHPFKSRLITIKSGTPEETKIRGWMNFGLNVTGEKRFVDLLMNAGVGIYNSMGCGSVGVVEN